jgi:CheY-like chemotaxis protein
MSTPINILLAEPNAAHTELILGALHALQPLCKIQCAKNAQEVLDVLFHTGKYASRPSIDMTPDVILLDPDLPTLGGLELLRIFRAYHRLNAILVILCSSPERRFSSEAYTAYVVYDTVWKSPDSAKFVQALQQAISPVIAGKAAL